MLIPTNERNVTKGNGPGQHKFRDCEICHREFRDYLGCILIVDGMRYVLCKTHLRFSRNHNEHFLVVVKAFRLGSPVSSSGVVV